MYKHILIGSILTISVLLQLATSFLAAKMIRVTGRRISWGLIALSIFFMALRRGISLFHFLSGGTQSQPGLLFVSVGLITSSLMLAGVILIAPVFRSMAEEINRRKAAEEALLKSERKLRSITSNMGEGMYVLDEGGRLTFMNPAAERLLGWTIDELNEGGPHNLVHFRKTDGTPLPFAECQMHSVITTGITFRSNDEAFVRKDGTVFPISAVTSPIMENGKLAASVTVFQDITEQKLAEEEREHLIIQLRNSLAKVDLLKGLLPICASCKKIRDDKGYWNQMEVYIRDHSEAEFSHGICPECAEKALKELGGFSQTG